MISTLNKRFGLLLISLLFFSGLMAHEAPFDVKAHYTKNIYSIQMRDGVKLFTVVYEPKDQTKK